MRSILAWSATVVGGSLQRSDSSESGSSAILLDGDRPRRAIPVVNPDPLARALLAGVGCLVLAANPTFAQANPVSLETADRIRAFLEAPPRFAHLSVRRVLVTTPIGFRNRREAAAFLEKVRSGSLVPKGQTSHFEIRFQTEPPAFFLRALADPAELDRPRTARLSPLAGRFQDDWWSILPVDPGQIQILRSADGVDVTAEGRTNDYHRGNARWATEYLRLGMFEVLPESIRWQADPTRFRARTEASQSILGRVEGWPAEGDSESAAIHLDFGKELPGRRIELLSTNDAGQWLPLRIRVSRTTAPTSAGGPRPGDGTEELYATLEVLHHALAAQPLGREHFSPEPYLRTNDLWVELEKGRFYVLEASGTGVVRRLAPPQEAGWNMAGIGRWVLITVVTAGAASLGAKAFLERRGNWGIASLRSKEKPSQTTRRNK